MHPHPPNIVVLAGPNGAGKSTSAPFFLRGALNVPEFVNADTIAKGLSSFRPEQAALSAGRIMLKRLDELASDRRDFAFETTLASKSFVPWLRRLIDEGYCVHLIFLWLPDAELAVARVQERVRLGGHDVPRATIHRRYGAGLRNFFRLYQPLTTSWHFWDNSQKNGPRRIALGHGTMPAQVLEPAIWSSILEKWAS